MKSKTIVPLVVGLAVGIVAIKYTLDAVKKAKGGQQPTDVVAVVIARQDIHARSLIAPDLLILRQTPKSPLLPRDCFHAIEDLKERVAKKSIPQGVPISESMLAEPGTPAGLIGNLPPGYRAVAVKIDESSGVAYLVKPEDWVDVLAVMDMRRNGKTETSSRVVLERVQVGAVGQAQNEQGNESPHRRAQTVTLILKKENVPKLHLAQTRGRITLAMRGPDEPKTAEPDGGEDTNAEGIASRLFEVWRNSAQVPAPPQHVPAPPPQPKPEPVRDDSTTVRVINNTGKEKAGGGHETTITFSNDETLEVVPSRPHRATPVQTPPREMPTSKGPATGSGTQPQASNPLHSHETESDDSDCNEVHE